jgi:DNA-binding CsgD family transcriptional regulator
VIVTLRDDDFVDPTLWDRLTATERAVMKLYANGSSRGSIALTLHLSKHSVSHALAAVKDKLHANTLGQAAALYKRYLDNDQ